LATENLAQKTENLSDHFISSNNLIFLKEKIFKTYRTFLTSMQSGSNLHPQGWHSKIYFLVNKNPKTGKWLDQ
jgi:hypothetical protein